MKEDFRNQLMKDSYYLEYIKYDELAVINQRMEDYAKLKNITLPLHKALKVHVALRIKTLAKRSSCRLLAEICFPEDHPHHGTQMDGRDLKRWAAIVIGDIFTSAAIESHGEYWHEY